jgi:hypothetical protein
MYLVGMFIYASPCRHENNTQDAGFYLRINTRDEQSTCDIAIIRPMLLLLRHYSELVCLTLGDKNTWP